MFINPNTEVSLCFTYIVDTTVTIAFVNHVGFVDVLSFKLKRDLIFLVSQITSKIQLFRVKPFSLFINLELAFSFLSQNGILIVIRLLSSNKLVGIIGSSSCKRYWKDLIVLDSQI